MPVNQGVFDEVMDNALLVFRHAASARKATVKRLQELEKELVAALAVEAITARQKRRVEAFFKETNKVIARRYQQLQLEFAYSELARTVAIDLQYGLQTVLGVDAMYLPRNSYFASLESNVMILGAPSADWWRGQSEDLQFKFAQQVRQGLANSETNQQIISRIVGKNGEPGVMETARRNAAALVQTSVQAVANDARRETFKANSDVISGIRQVSTLDSHTSLVCVAYSEAEWDLDFKPKGKNKKPYNGGVPRHFNCRSVEVPITKTFAELGLKNVPEPKFTTRASDEGQIKADTTFKNFLERKSKAYQDEMLGKGRAELWRAGKITLKDLVDGKGRPLTLAELQALVKRKRR
jgi:hypothetical protein